MQACLHATAHQRIQEMSLVECSLLKLVKVLLDILQKDLNIIPILFLILSLGKKIFESTLMWRRNVVLKP